MKLQKGTSHNNLFDKELFTFTTLSEETNGAYTEMKITLQKGGSAGAGGPLHIHPNSSEKFMVRTGKIAVQINSETKIVSAGETYEVPPGTPHVFKNISDSQTVVDIVFTSALKNDLFFANFSAARELHPEWFKNGKVPIYFFAKLADTYPNQFYFPRIPIFLQKLTFRLIHSLGKLFFGKDHMKFRYES